MRILLIDDDKDDQGLFCEAVKIISPEINCDVANNGEEGLRLLQSYRVLPVLVFLDINMPVMDGRETFKLIRSTPRLTTLAVTIYSTSNNKEEINEFTNLGASYITKPNSFEELVKLLRNPVLRAVHQHSNAHVLIS
jgi:DNA-binding response OmpR family regulator